VIRSACRVPKVHSDFDLLKAANFRHAGMYVVVSVGNKGALVNAPSVSIRSLSDAKEAPLVGPCLPRSSLPGSPAEAAGTLAAKVAELPSLAVETRQLGGSGQPGGSGAPGGAAEGGRSRWVGEGAKEAGICTFCQTSKRVRSPRDVTVECFDALQNILSMADRFGGAS